MEGGSTSDNYQITNAQIPIFLVLKRIRDLKPHEQTIKEDLDRLTTALERDPVLRHPIITDKNTGLVLDGNHRLAALIELGCKLIPCATLDYQDPSIVVGRWFREISGASLDSSMELIKPHMPLRVTPMEAEKRLGNREGYASIQNAGSCFVLESTDKDKDALTLVRLSFEIEERARKSALKIAYNDDNSVPKSANEFLLSTICLNKQEIVAAVTSDRVFPPKTTRHIIPSRPLGLGVPLEWLRSTDLGIAQKRFFSLLKKLKVRRLPRGAWVGSRRYEEEVFLFE